MCGCAGVCVCSGEDLADMQYGHVRHLITCEVVVVLVLPLRDEVVG